MLSLLLSFGIVVDCIKLVVFLIGIVGLNGMVFIVMCCGVL